MAQNVRTCPRCDGERFLWKSFWKWEWLSRCRSCKGKGSIKAKLAAPPRRRATAELADAHS